MNDLETVPTKTLEMLWNGVHKQAGLGADEFVTDDGLCCTLGSVEEIMAKVNKYVLDTFENPSYKGDPYDNAFAAFGMSHRAWSSISIESDMFWGTHAERRIHMLQFLGAELMTRGDIEVGFKEKVEAIR